MLRPSQLLNFAIMPHCSHLHTYITSWYIVRQALLKNIFQRLFSKCLQFLFAFIFLLEGKNIILQVPTLMTVTWFPTADVILWPQTENQGWRETRMCRNSCLTLNKNQKMWTERRISETGGPCISLFSRRR